jgi:hypothetical protein
MIVPIIRLVMYGQVGSGISIQDEFAVAEEPLLHFGGFIDYIRLGRQEFSSNPNT